MPRIKFSTKRKVSASKSGASLSAKTLAIILRKTIYLLTILFLLSCNASELEHNHDFVVFENDSRDKDIGFKPTASQIDKAEQRLLDYLESKTKTKQTIFVNSLDGKVPLQDRLKYYKRRYFGRTSNEVKKIIKIEFVFVRCGGQDEWKKLDYTNDNSKDCWWSVQYDIDHDLIYDLKLWMVETKPLTGVLKKSGSVLNEVLY